MKSQRTLALEWWRSLSIDQQKKAVDDWKHLAKDDFRATWSFEMISMSSNTIQSIWEAIS